MSNAYSLRTPKYRHHKAKGLAVVTLSGRDIYLGKYGSTASKQKYKRLIAEYLQRGGIGIGCSPKEITVNEVMAAYIAYAKQYYRKSGKPTREYGLFVEICRVIRPLYGKSKAADFGPLALKAVRQEFIDVGISRSHINKQVSRIKRMFKWAAAEELIPAGVPQALSMVAGLKAGRCKAPERPPVLPVNSCDVEATLEYLPETVADMVRFQRLTGCRPQEVCNLKPVDLIREGEVWIYRPASHKTEHQGRERLIFIGPKAQQVLMRYLARDSETYCFRPCDSERKRRLATIEIHSKSLVNFLSKDNKRKRIPKRKPGKHYSTDSYRRAIKRACAKASVEPWSPNQLRHSAATEIRKEFGLEAAQVILGHSQANITQVYAERDLAKGLKVAAIIG